jgi:predicted nucleic acid-binding protein
MIVDTSYVLDLLDGDEDAFQKGRELTDARTPLLIPAMTIVELFIGYGATEDEEEARTVENVLLGHPVIEIDEVIARRAGWVAGQTGIDLGDAVIGATAVARDEPVLTRNVKDFEKIDGIEIEAY